MAFIRGDLLAGFGQDFPLQALALHILIFEKAGEFAGPFGRRRRQQIDDEPRTAEPAGGVEPRCDAEGDVLGPQRRRRVDLRRFEQRREFRAVGAFFSRCSPCRT